ncbi:MAG: hypothetical protein BalsKO_22500 [Balneolaceae bacterium]
MKTVYESFQLLGQNSLDVFWFPLGIWTLVALFVFISLMAFKNLNPLYHYHLRVAILAAIPFGLTSSVLLQAVQFVFNDTTNFDPAIFIVESSIMNGYYNGIEAAVFSPNWFEPNFLIGTLSAVLFFISLIMIARLVWSYFTLRKLNRSLTPTSLGEFHQFESLVNKRVQVAYHDHPLVPFTFGWKRPVIVLPYLIKDDQEKVRMAVQHELVHIKRRDYLLQLILSVIESVFWFHPLIRLGSKEIEIYREISCDQEVLNTSGISQKNYATMLFELVPLNRGMGSFSVSMAVKQSTLKKRIETMKYHKLNKTSFKRSLLFLLLMITAITIPMACSDMRGPEGLSPEELENTTLEMKNVSISINGIEVLKKSGTQVTGTGIHSFFVKSGEYGIFKISPLPFNGGKPVGDISSNIATFKINELDVVISSETNLLSNIDEAEIWVEHAQTKAAEFSIGVGKNDISLRDYIQENTNNIFQGSVSENGDYFAVVEEMPKLIGGLSGLQSKVEYPEMAKKEGIEGRVIVQFIINKNGDVENPKIIRGIGGGCDEAALEAIKAVKFEPGFQRGQSVRVQYSLPIIFKLSDTQG